MDTLLQRAETAFHSGDYADAIPLLNELAAQNIPEALNMLGSAFHLGLGVEPSGQDAVRLLTKAAECGVGVAAHNLGTLYITGMQGVLPDRSLGRH